jgi:hypothetical protein
MRTELKHFIQDMVFGVGIVLFAVAVCFFAFKSMPTPAPEPTLLEECAKAANYVRAVEGCERSMGCTFELKDMELYVETYDYGRKYCNASSPIEEPKTTTRD